MNINEWVNGQSRDADNTTLGKQDTKQTTQHWANKTQNKQHNTGQTRHKTTTQHWANKTQNKQHNTGKTRHKTNNTTQKSNNMR